MDFYRHHMKLALWTWREERKSRYHAGPRRKNRRDGRAEKRSARQRERAEVEQLAAAAPMDAAWDAAIDSSTCPCGECVSERARAAIPVGPAHRS